MATRALPWSAKPWKALRETGRIGRRGRQHDADPSLRVYVRGGTHVSMGCGASTVAPFDETTFLEEHEPEPLNMLPPAKIQTVTFVAVSR